MKKLLQILVFVCLSFATVQAQNTQTIKGQITDLNSKYPLFGATVVVLNTSPLIGGVTDDKGYYKLSNIPIGRQTVKISLVGYKEVVIPNILLTTAKEYVLDAGLEEKIITGNVVEVTAKGNLAKGEVKNEMVMVSGRTFNVEETRRYAGSRNDPSRMASNYAGVNGVNDNRNDIIVRGNSPLGVLWRMEGVDIPNPSHFGAVGATGGPVSMLNNNIMATSDFMTGAYPAEFGNANSGVFDLSLRKGNRDKREYLGQIGFNGFELGAEGPFKMGGKSSYLVNARYSNLRTFALMGIPIGTGSAIPDYYDLSFKLNFPMGKMGNLSFWGIGGSSKINFKGSADDTANFYSGTRENLNYRTSMAVSGLNYTHFFGTKTYGRLSIAQSFSRSRADQDSLSPNFDNPTPYFKDNTTYGRTTVRYLVNHKFNVRSTLNAGVYVDVFSTQLNSKLIYYRPDGTNFLRDFKKEDGSTQLYQAHAQYQYKFTDNLSANAGVHYQRFQLSGADVLEPRASVQYSLNEKSSLSFGYGLHSVTQPLAAYYQRTYYDTEGKDYAYTTKNMDFTRSHQYVLGYNRALGENTRLKAEAYYQNLFKVPVSPFTNNTFSMLNFGADFNYPDFDSLVNTGLGRNYGLELTLERFFSKGYYFLVTTSLFDSKYRSSDGKWRNTAFNSKYILNVLAGKEFKTSDKNTFAFDLKLTTAGGRFYTPVDVAESIRLGKAYYNPQDAYSKQLPTYFRADLKFTYRRNGAKVMQEWFIDMQNITNRENVFQRGWNADKNKETTIYQLGLFPLINYRIQF